MSLIFIAALPFVSINDGRDVWSSSTSNKIVDPITILATSTSSFFNCLPPRIPRARRVSCKDLRMLSRSPLFTLILEMRIAFRFETDEASNKMDVQFLHELFSSCIQLHKVVLDGVTFDGQDSITEQIKLFSRFSSLETLHIQNQRNLFHPEVVLVPGLTRVDEVNRLFRPFLSLDYQQQKEREKFLEKETVQFLLMDRAHDYLSREQRDIVKLHNNPVFLRRPIRHLLLTSVIFDIMAPDLFEGLERAISAETEEEKQETKRIEHDREQRRKRRVSSGEHDDDDDYFEYPVYTVSGLETLTISNIFLIGLMMNGGSHSKEENDDAIDRTGENIAFRRPETRFLYKLASANVRRPQNPSLERTNRLRCLSICDPHHAIQLTMNEYYHCLHECCSLEELTLDNIDLYHPSRVVDLVRALSKNGCCLRKLHLQPSSRKSISLANSAAVSSLMDNYNRENDSRKNHHLLTVLLTCLSNTIEDVNLVFLNGKVIDDDHQKKEERHLLPTRLPFLKSLRIAHCHLNVEGAKILGRALSHAPNFTDFTWGDVGVDPDTSEVVKTLFDEMNPRNSSASPPPPPLRRLIVEHCPQVYLFDADLSPFKDTLETLIFRAVPSLSYHTLDRLVSSQTGTPQPRLSRFEFTLDQTSFTESGTNNGNIHLLRAMMFKKQRLGSKLLGSAVQLERRYQEIIATKFLNLSTLVLTGNADFFGEETLRLISIHLSKLNSLSLIGWQKLNRNSISETLFAHPKVMTHENSSHREKNNVVSSSLRKLEVVNGGSRTIGLSDQKYSYFAYYLRNTHSAIGIHHLTSLEELTWDGLEVSQGDFLASSNMFPNLRSLTILGFSRGDTGGRALAEANSFVRLMMQRFMREDCNNDRSSGLFPRLEVFKIRLGGHVPKKDRDEVAESARAVFEQAGKSKVTVSCF